MVKDLVEYMARSLVDAPNSVEVTEIKDGSALILELTVADADMGRVIGKRGRVVNAMRTLVDVAAEKEGRRVMLEIVD
jgi:predicted RNA-binding protein YlqC (UPF0109 family)